MKRTVLLLLTCAASLTADAIPTYEPFTEYAGQIVSSPVNLFVTTSNNVPLGTNANSAISNCLDLATGALVAPGGEHWATLNFSGTGTTNLHGIDVAVISNSAIFTSANLTSLLPSTFPGFPASGGISTIVENPAQPLIWNGSSYVNFNYVGNSPVLKFAQDITRPASGTKTIYVSYLFSVVQQGQLGTGNDGRYFAFLASSNLVEGVGSGGAYTNWAQMFNSFVSGGFSVHYSGQGLLQNGSSAYIGPCDSAAGKTFASSPFSSAYNTPNFVVAAYTFATGAVKDTNALWVNPAVSSFGGTTPPASPVHAYAMTNFSMSDIGGICLIDRVGNGASGGVGTNYIANLLIGTTWSYVTGGPEFTNQPPVNTAANVGANVSISGAATAAGQSVNYQWVKITGGVTNNVNNGAGGAGGTATVSGANTSTLTLNGFSAGDVGNYQLVATASSTSYTMNSSTAALALADPQITVNPAGTAANSQQSASFTATTTTATAPLSFAWYFGSTPISNGLQPDGSYAIGATGTTGAGTSFNLTLTLTNVSYLDIGNYTLYVTNNSGFSASSVAAALFVRDPYIAAQPANPAVVAGGNASFTVGAAGSPTVTYQWSENGTPLTDGNPTATGAAIVSGSQTATLTLTSVQDADDGSYTCTITGTASTQTTNTSPAILTVQDSLTITVPPMSRTERAGDHLAFSVGVAGGGPSFQWSFNGNPIPGATASALVLTNIQSGTNGIYAVTVQNLATAPQTVSATLTVINSTVLNLSSANLIVSRVGDGAQPLSLTTGNTVYLDQFSTSGTYQNTVQIPDEAAGSPYGTGSFSSVFGSPALLVAGAGADAGYEAMLTLSFLNQQYLGLAGYCQAYPFNGGNVNSQPGTSWRGLATINAFGTYAMAYTNSGLYSAGPQLIRSMETLDGTNFWTTGAASGGTVKFVNSTVAGYAGGTGVPSSSGDSAAGGRVIQIINGALPAAGFSSVSNLVFSETGLGGNNGLYAAVGAPEPGTGGSIAFTPLLYTGGGQPGDFAFSPDNATIYVADAGVYSGSGSPGTGGIERWDSDGSGWTYSYTLAVLPGEITNPGVVTNGAQGLIADFSANPTWGSGVTGAKLYVTTYDSQTNSLVQVIDNGNPSVTPATITVLATAGPNQAFRGVRFGPTVVLPAVVTAPQNKTNFPGNTLTFGVLATGSGPLSYQWLQNGTPLANGPDPLGSGATISGVNSTTLSIGGSGVTIAADNGSTYAVVVSNPAGQSVTSAPPAILTVTAGAPTITPATLPSYTESVGDHVGWGPFINGTMPITYNWFVSGNPNPIATGTITNPGVGGLSLATIQTTNSATYTLSVSNQFGTRTASGVLTVTTTKQLLSSTKLVVARIGDSVQALSGATGNTLYLDQYSTTGGYVNTVQIPDEGTGLPYGTGSSASTDLPFGSPALLFVGGGAYAGVDAVLSLAPNGQTLNFAGYCQAYPFSGPDLTVGANGGNNWRGIGAIDAYGYYTLCWTNTGLYSGGNHQVHGAVDLDGNGTNFYTTGQAGSGFGLKYCNTNKQPANGGGIASVTATFDGSRVAQVINGNLFFSDAAASPRGIYTCAGLPTGAAGATLLITEPSSPLDFAASPDLNTIYIADGAAFGGTSAQAGGIQRWDANGAGGYNFSYTLGTGTGSAVGARGLTVDFSASANWGVGVTGAKLYATTAELSGNRLIKITDTGSASAATLLVAAFPAEMLAGVQFGPTIVPPSFAMEPQNESGFAGHAVTFSAEALGSGPLTYQWYFQPGGVGPFSPVLNATNSSFTINPAGSGNVGNYYVVATNPGGLTIQSSTVSFTLAPLPQFTSETNLGPGSGIQLNFTGPASFNYSIWTATDVTLTPVSSTWTKLTTGTFSGGTDTYTDTSAGANPQQFYIISVP